MQVRVTRLANGLRVVTDTMPHLRTAAPAAQPVLHDRRRILRGATAVHVAHAALEPRALERDPVCDGLRVLCVCVCRLVVLADVI